MSTVFELIIQGKIPSEKVYESERVLAIKDIHPVAPVHLLIMPKEHVPNLQALTDYSILEEIVEVAQELAEKFGVADGYRLLTNNGEYAGQTIFHLHFHLIGGRVLGAMA